LRIDSVETHHARLPLPGGAWGDTIHHVTHLEIILAEVRTDKGLVGTGFTYTSDVGGHSIRAMIDKDLAPVLVGEPVSPRGLWHKCASRLQDMGSGASTMAMAATDIALWDLVAKEAQKPLVDVLGRSRDRVQVYASGINLNKSLEEVLDQARGWRAGGYAAFKVKVGKPDIAEDVERLTKLRELLGPLPLMVDANQGWDIGHALRAIEAFRPLDLHWVEEPLPRDDVEGHARLRRLVRSPIATGENIYTLRQVNDFLARGACDFMQADVCRVGGITAYLDIAALARAWNVPLAPHFMMEISGQLLCCLPNGHIVENIDGGSLTDIEALAEPIEVRNGFFASSDKVGHGIVFDRDFLARHAV
jgi:L-alanine-DL-glutamate epimerase-like enolase superfamily enzyme